MNITNYGELKTAIADLLSRDDLTSEIPLFVQLFETEFSRSMRVGDMEASTTITADSSGIAALPADFQDVRGVTMAYGGSTYHLQNSVPPAIAWMRSEPGAQPSRFYTQGTNLFLAPVASGSVTLDYYAKVPALTTDASTNWLLTKHPDAYLYGSLVQAQLLTQDDQRLATLAAIYKGVKDQIQRSDGGRWANSSARPPGPCP